MRLRFRTHGLTRRRLREWNGGGLATAPLAVGTMVLLMAAEVADFRAGRVELAADVEAVVSSPVIAVSGTVTDTLLERVRLVVNGVGRDVSVEAGAFRTSVPLVRGRNTIQAFIRPTVFSAPIEVTADIPASDIWIELTWEGAGDVDLHLHLPNGEHAYYRQRSTPSGAVLDVDNTQRDGPEHITMTDALAGEYRVEVHYYAAAGPPRPVPWAVRMRLRDGAELRAFSDTLRHVGERSLVDTFSFE